MAGTLKMVPRVRERFRGHCIGQRYVLGRELGSGSSATVYGAHDTHKDRQVAVKLLHRGSDNESGRWRFICERESLNRLAGSPHVVTLLDSGEEEDGQLFLVLERVHGVLLAELLSVHSKVRTKLRAETILRWFGQLCLAMSSAHSAGVVHRDIKPSNIILTRTDPEDILLIDFGVASTPDLPMESRQHWFGTQGYMSPEQEAGTVDLTATTDVYSIGLVLLEMLTTGLKKPLQRTPLSVLVKLREWDYIAYLRKARKDCPASLFDVLSRALKRQPDERFPSADSLLAALSL